MYKLVKLSLSITIISVFFSVYSVIAYTDWGGEHEHHQHQYGQSQGQQGNYNYQHQQQYAQPQGQQGNYNYQPQRQYGQTQGQQGNYNYQHQQQYGQAQGQQGYNYYQHQQYYGQSQGQQGYGNYQYHQNYQNNENTTTRTTIYLNPGSIYTNPYINPYTYPYSYPYAATQVWVWSQNGNVPMNAVVNQNLNNMATYFCRVISDNNMYNGVLVPNDGCYVQIEDQYVLFINYQVLVTLGY